MAKYQRYAYAIVLQLVCLISLIGTPTDDGLLDSLTTRLTELAEPSQRVDLLLQLTDYFYDRDMLAEEEYYINEAYAQAQLLPPGPPTFRVLYYYGRTLRQKGLHKQAFTHYFAALDTFQVFAKALDPNMEIALLMDIGWAYHLLEQFELSEDYYQQAIDKSLTRQDSLKFAQVLINLGEVYNVQGKDAAYLDAMQQALDIYRRHGKEEMGLHIMDFMFPTQGSDLCLFDTDKLQVILAQQEAKSDTTTFFYQMASVHYLGCVLESGSSQEHFYTMYSDLIRKLPSIGHAHYREFLATRLLNISQFIGDTLRQQSFKQMIDQVQRDALQDEANVLQQELHRRISKEDAMEKDQLYLQKHSRRLSLLLLVVALVGVVGYWWQGRRRIQLQQRLLQRQLDSHFLRNAMGIIHNDLLHNQTEAAIIDTVIISRIIDRFLGFSHSERILLNDEIGFLKDYIAIEQKRFDQLFKVEWHIPESLLTQAILIPPMLIQPLLENAIRHGQIHKQAKGWLKVFIHLRDRRELLIAVENSTEPNAQLNIDLVDGHSLAMIQQRLQLLRAGQLSWTTSGSSLKCQFSINI